MEEQKNKLASLVAILCIQICLIAPAIIDLVIISFLNMIVWNYPIVHLTGTETINFFEASVFSVWGWVIVNRLIKEK